MSTHRLVQFAAGIIVFVAAYLIFSTSDPARAFEETKTGAPGIGKSGGSRATAELKGEAVPGKAPVARAKKVDPRNLLKLPDGTSVPVLNGAYGAPALGWPPSRPWSPIIGRETDRQGDEWYVHKDGSRTITKNVYHSHIHAFAPSTSVFNPTKVAPMAPEELARVKERMEREARAKNKKR